MSFSHSAPRSASRARSPLAALAVAAVFAAACSEAPAGPTPQATPAASVAATGSVPSTATAAYVIKRLRYTQSCSGYTCTFDASSSSGFTSFVWIFGDGTYAVGTKVTHTYPAKNASYLLSLASGGATVRKLVACSNGRCF